jgi:flagellar motor switch protein FliG
MKTAIPGIRKAAILVASLDPDTARGLLACFTPEQAEQLRAAAAALGPIDRQQQQRVLEEFLRVEPLVPVKQPAGLELGDRTTRPLKSPAPRWLADDQGVELELSGEPFHFLQDAEADKLARALLNERPQTIALVLSHLPPQRAGGVLARLESGLQVDVIRRLVDLEETDPEILREVEQALETRLSQQVHMQRRRVAAISAVSNILRSSASQVGTQILHNLSRRDQSLAEKLGPGRIEFDDLTELDSAGWATLLHAADSEIAILALVGSEPELIEKVLRRMPPGEAQIIRRQLDHPGPMRLRDVEQARQELAELATRLAAEGRLSLIPMERRLPVGTAA